MKSKSSRASKGGRERSLVGRDVWYRGHVWRVTGMQEGDSQGSPWLTLRRGVGIKAFAKNYEVIEALN
ncbi:MAG: hypothetical protein RBU37_01020 [Myxococcota bacterium]|nr:hypothetical protein [Myxococcota bacterium]